MAVRLRYLLALLFAAACGGTHAPVDKPGQRRAGLSAGFLPDETCAYYASHQAVISCAGRWTELTLMRPEQDARTCPAWYQGGGRSYAALGDGMADLQCDASCVYRARSATALQYCGAKV